MIKTDDAIRIARAQMGTPYVDLDCINLIKRVIRTAPGGDPSYTTAGTNALWNSYDSTPKYKDLVWRRDGIGGAQAGMLAFKTAHLTDVQHVGLVTRDGTVIHASSVHGKTVETPLTAKEGWTHIAQHRYIAIAADVAANEPEDRPAEAEWAKVVLADQSSYLNIRNAPDGQKIGRLFHDDVVQILAAADGWAFVQHENGAGYVAASFLEPTEKPVKPEKKLRTKTTIKRSDGVMIAMDGHWDVAED